METKIFRSKSLARLARAGLDIPATLPLIDGFSIRPVERILDRIICLNAVAAVAHGFNKDRASAWLSQEGMLKNLTDEERLFLTSGVGDGIAFKVQVEGLWALAWIVGVVADFNFWRGCDPHFVAMLPNLKTGESSSNFRARAHLRGGGEIGVEVDLAYCLHWALREAEVNGAPAPTGILPYIVTERRRALEWAIGAENWESVSLDT